jgi:Na+/H+-dicarboxylate symporter
MSRSDPVRVVFMYLRLCDSISRAITNLIGNCVATVVIASWEHDIDFARARAVPDGATVEEASDVPGREMAPS